jgi:hydrogenase maturation factor
MSDLCNLIIVNIITSAKFLLNVIGVDKDIALHLLTFKMDKKWDGVLIHDGADVKLINLKEE